MKAFTASVLVLCIGASAAATESSVLGLDFPTPEEVFHMPGDRILVRVGGIPITTVMLVRRNYPHFARLMNTRAEGIRARNWSEQSERQFLEYWDFMFRQTLVMAIRDELLHMLAKKANLVAFPSLVEKRTEEELSRLGGERALKERGLTIDDVKEDVKKNLLIDTVIQTQRPPTVPIGPLEARRYYRKHLGDFTLGTPGCRLRIISLPEKTAKDEDNRPAVDKVLEEVKSGKDFAHIAARRSIHPSRNYGGLLLKVLESGFKTDILTGKDIPRTLSEKLPALEEGKVYGPMTAEGRYHLVLLEKRFPPGQIPFEELANSIINHLTRLEENATMQRWLIRLARQSGITGAAGKSIAPDVIFGFEPPGTEPQ